MKTHTFPDKVMKITDYLVGAEEALLKEHVYS